MAIVVAAVAVRLASVPSPRTMRFDVAAHDVAVPGDAAAIARGRHLSDAVAVCTVCHGDDLGGRLAFEHPLLGRGYTPNLTSGRGGVGASYRAADWERALRHGVDRSGRGLLFMPVDHYQHLSDADLGAMIAYYRSLAPVDNDRTGLELTLLARTMIDLGLSGPVVRAAQLDHSSRPPSRPQRARRLPGRDRRLHLLPRCRADRWPGPRAGRAARARAHARQPHRRSRLRLRSRPRCAPAVPPTAMRSIRSSCRGRAIGA